MCVCIPLGPLLALNFLPGHGILKEEKEEEEEEDDLLEEGRQRRRASSKSRRPFSLSLWPEREREGPEIPSLLLLVRFDALFIRLFSSFSPFLLLFETHLLRVFRSTARRIVHFCIRYVRIGGPMIADDLFARSTVYIVQPDRLTNLGLLSCKQLVGTLLIELGKHIIFQSVWHEKNRLRRRVYCLRSCLSLSRLGDICPCPFSSHIR